MNPHGLLCPAGLSNSLLAKCTCGAGSLLRVGRYSDSQPSLADCAGKRSCIPWSPGRQPTAARNPAFHAAAAILSITLAACATTKPEPQIVTKEVQVPIMVKCHPDIGPEPDYPDTDAKLKAAPDLFSKTQALVAGRLMRIARDAVKSAALSACEG